MFGLLVRLKGYTISALLTSFLLFSTTRQSPPANVVVWEGSIDGVSAWVTVVNQTEQTSDLRSVGNAWWKLGNTIDSDYVFSFGSPENARLVLSFSKQANGASQAEIFVADLGQSALEYTLGTAGLDVVTNDGHPYLVVQTRQGDWVVDGRTNYDLDILIDGAHSGEFGPVDAPIDGKPDILISVGADYHNAPSWQTTKLLQDPYPTRGYRRFEAQMRLPDAPVFRTAPPFFPSFPYLSFGTNPGSWYEQNRPPLFFDLSDQRLSLNPFPGFQEGGLFAVGSISNPPYVNFEVPFGWYNFDSATRQAHLVVRGGYSPAEAPLSFELPSPRLGVRYSWKTDDDQRWRYGLQLSDFHEYSDEVTIGDTKIIAVHPEEWPEWVISRPWRAVTLVEAVKGYPGSEGIYFYAADLDDWLWLAGLTETGSGYLEAPLLQETAELTALGSRTLPAGFRGEYMVARTEPPQLYFSPVDSMLHLKGAQGGIWYLGQEILLRSTDLNGDGVLDAWTRENAPSELDEESGFPRAFPGEIMDALYDSGRYLLHSGGGSATILKSIHDQAEFTVSPPTDKESWQLFRTQMRPFESQHRDPTDLRGWLDAFPGPRSEIAGASLANVRITDAGFRFELTLEAGYQATGNDLLGVSGLAPGEYVVEYRNDAFTIARLTPPELSLQVKPLSEDAAALPLQAVVTNNGIGDASGLVLVAEGVDRDGAVTELTREPVDALAGQTAQVLLDVPSSRHTSRLTIRLENADGVVMAAAEWTALADHENMNASAIYGLAQVPVLMPVLGSFAVLIAIAAVLAVRAQREDSAV